MVLEVCCGSYEDAMSAYMAGAKRIELNCGLELGGLTPSLSSLELVKQFTDLKSICMVRPRSGGFCYTMLEFEQMMREARDLLEAGADGLAFGFLTPDCTIDMNRTALFAYLCHDYGAKAVFHRAFDCLGCETRSDFKKAIDSLVECGVDRILTSGMYPDAYEGIENLKTIIDVAGSRIEILPGCGINSRNVADIIERTGATQVHASCKTYAIDKTTTNEKISYAYEGNLKLEDGAYKYQVVSEDEAKAIIDVLNNIEK